MSSSPSEPEKKKHRIRPYARLLTMLGEQLIKNERIALVELIKNSYDADASWVKVSFEGFEEGYGVTAASKIIIEDDGLGMTRNTIENHWLNPATPLKKIGKEAKDSTAKGRKIQGEKGIGRFALLKLGRKVKLVTRAESSDTEEVVTLDLSAYDDDFLQINGKNAQLFLDDIPVSIEERAATEIVNRRIHLGVTHVERKGHGTRIEISNLKGSWSDEKITAVYHDIARLESIFTEEFLQPPKEKEEGKPKEFEVFIERDRKMLPFSEEYREELRNLIHSQSVIRIEQGRYDESAEEFTFFLNGASAVLPLKSADLTGIKLYKDYFGEGGKKLDTRGTKCGSFNFGFFVFDFSSKAPPKHKLDKSDKEIIRDHRIYLYRDGIRVYPYGDPDDDWLQIDAYRGTISAGDFLSNDQVVGFVNISHKENPLLKDKTNREGLIETGNATSDFICLIQSFLAYIRSKPYARYRSSLKFTDGLQTFQAKQIEQDFDELKKLVKGNPSASALVNDASKRYMAERDYLVQRAETTEELAGVGLSVETASHDVTSMMEKALSVIDALLRNNMQGRQIDPAYLDSQLNSLRGMLSFIDAQLKDIKLLFKSSKQRRRDIRVKDVLEKVLRVFGGTVQRANISVDLAEVGSPVVAKTTEAVLLQMLLNLFDNSVYWLQAANSRNPKIQILLDGQRNVLVFSDNGPGVRPEDAPYIFEPFFSGKGQEGSGLGLYIARQLLERHEYSIELAELRKDKQLSGANFIITFVRETE